MTLAGKEPAEDAKRAIRRAIELSVTKYCAVHATLKDSFPIALTYLIYEDDQLIKQGTYEN